MTAGSVAFSAGAWLWALLLVPLAFWLWRGLLGGGGSRFERSAPYLRSLALTSLVLAMSDPSWSVADRGIDFHAVIDRSMSMGMDRRGEIDALVAQLAESLGPKDRLSLYAFGRGAARLGQHVAGSSLPDLNSVVIDPTGTDIEKALRTVLAHADPDRSARVLLVTDGLENAGRAEDAVPLFQERSIPIDGWVFDSYLHKEIAIERLSAPASVAPRQRYAAHVVVTSTIAADAEIHLYRDGLFVAARNVSLEPGRSVIAFDDLMETEELARSVRYEARLYADEDTWSENNVGYALARVGGDAAVLIVSDQPEQSEALRQALLAQGLRAESASVRSAPLDLASLGSFAAVILDNVEARQLSVRQMENIVQYVEDLGGGLLVVGGERSFGLGGYRDSPLERALPVSMDAPQDLVSPSLAMVLALDRSGSMAETQGGFSKLDLAKEAALRALDIIHESDLLGVIAFDSEPERVVPIQSARNRLAIAAGIASLTIQGGTNLRPALEAAFAELSGVEAAVKHLIVLSDGRSNPQLLEPLIRTMRARGITVSAVAIGSGADQELLESISRWGDGRYYYSEDIRAIPQIFAAETMVVARPLLVNEPFRPEWHHAADFWPESAPLPPLGGYVIATPKATASVHLRAPDESPILATWRRGLGKAATFHSSFTGPWSQAWQAWEGYDAFVGQLTRWLMRPAPGDGIIAELNVGEDQGELVVDAIDALGQYMNFLDLTAEIHSPDGERLSLPLLQEGPGRYRAAFPTGRQGAYDAVVRAADASSEGEPAGVIAGDVLAYPQELRAFGSDAALLARLARATGGTLIAAIGERELQALFDHPSPATRPRSLATPLLAAALLLFLTDALARYLPVAAVRSWLVAVPNNVNQRLAALKTTGGALRAKMEQTIADKDLEAEQARRNRHRKVAEAPVLQAFKDQEAQRYLAEKRKIKKEAEDDDLPPPSSRGST